MGLTYTTLNNNSSFIKLKGPAPGTDDSGIKVIRSNKTLQKMTEEERNLARGIPVLGLGIDKHSPEQLKKQQARARRFGLDINKNMEEGEIDDSEINQVNIGASYQSGPIYCRESPIDRRVAASRLLTADCRILLTLSVWLTKLFITCLCRLGPGSLKVERLYS